VIGGGLEAQVKLAAPDALYATLRKFEEQLRYLFIVSQVSLERAASQNGDTGLKVLVAKADGLKCERCWNYSTRVGEDAAYPTVCERCAPVLHELEAKAAQSNG
jgi:isoleucyl-tRNA synthetase